MPSHRLAGRPDRAGERPSRLEPEMDYGVLVAGRHLGVLVLVDQLLTACSAQTVDRAIGSYDGPSAERSGSQRQATTAPERRAEHGQQPCDKETQASRKGPRVRLHIALGAHADIHAVLGSPQPQPHAAVPGRVLATAPVRKRAQDPCKPADYHSVADVPRRPHSASCGALQPSSLQVREGGLEPPCP